MKRKFILLPITLTALAPVISMSGCKDSDEPKVITHTVTFSAGEHGSLEGESTVTVKGDKTTLGEIIKPTVVADEDNGWFFNGWDYDDSYVISDDVTITALYKQIDITIDLSIDQSTNYSPKTKSSPFLIEANKTYRFNIDAGICPIQPYTRLEPLMVFYIFKEDTAPIEQISVSITRVKVGETIFQSVESPLDLEAGKYSYYEPDQTLYYQDYSAPTPSFTMSVDLQFVSDVGESVIARWSDP